MRQTVFMMVFFLAGIVSSAAFAGDMEPAGPPASTSSYTLEDIYNRLDKGTAGSPKNYAGPATGPAPTGRTLNEVMDKAPQKDDTNGAAAGDVAQDKKFWGLNTATGQWGLQTGTRDDSAGTRWHDNGDGTVTDLTTGLVWLQNAYCVEALAGITGGNLNWLDAVTWSGVMKNESCGLTDNSEEGDWRLPTKNELAGITQGDEAVSSDEMRVFTGVQTSYYWSSTSLSAKPPPIWVVLLHGGDVGNADKTLTFYVWPVRAGRAN